MVPSLSLPAAGLMLKAFSIAASCSVVSGRLVVPSARLAVTDLVVSAAVGRSEGSASVKVIEPVSESGPLSLMAPSVSTPVTTGVSFTALMVMSRVAASKVPNPAPPYSTI